MPCSDQAAPFFWSLCARVCACKRESARERDCACFFLNASASSITSEDGVLQCIAVCGSVLQYVAVCCIVVQRVAACCSVLQGVVVSLSHYLSILNHIQVQNVAVFSSVLQCVAVCCSTAFSLPPHFPSYRRARHH